MRWAFVTEDLTLLVYRRANRPTPVKVAAHKCRAVSMAMGSAVEPMAVTASPTTDTAAEYKKMFFNIAVLLEKQAMLTGPPKRRVIRWCVTSVFGSGPTYASSWRLWTVSRCCTSSLF